MHCFCCKTYQEEEQMQEEDLRCSWSCISSYNVFFFSLNVSWLLPFWSNVLVSFYQPLGCLLCSWSRVVSSGETVEILCILLYWNVIPEWKSLFLVLILLFPWRILGFVGWNNSEAGARPLGFLLFYHTATGSTYLTVRVNLGLACFLNLLCCRRKTYLLSPPSAARN